MLFAAPGQPLRLFYKVGPSPRAWWGMVKASADGGRTWSEAIRLPSPLLGPIKNKPVILADGTWLSASSTEDSPTGWRAHAERSQDAGRTWEFIGPIDKGSWNLEAIQGSILSHPDGRLQTVGRTRSGVVFSSWSADAGRTWSPLEPLGLPNPNAGTDAVTLKDGRHLIVYNDAAPLPGTRGGKTVPSRRRGFGRRGLLEQGRRPRGSGAARRLRLPGRHPDVRRPRAHHVHVEPPAHQACRRRSPATPVAGVRSGSDPDHR